MKRLLACANTIHPPPALADTQRSSLSCLSHVTKPSVWSGGVAARAVRKLSDRLTGLLILSLSLIIFSFFFLKLRIIIISERTRCSCSTSQAGLLSAGQNDQWLRWIFFSYYTYLGIPNILKLLLTINSTPVTYTYICFLPW